MGQQRKKMAADHDDLEQFIVDRDCEAPGFAAKVANAEDAALARLALGRKLRSLRGRRTQAWVAARMNTTESIVRRVETGDDVRLSTLEKYAKALGKELVVELR